MRIKKAFPVFILYIMISLISFAEEKNDENYYQNVVYKEDIKSVQLFLLEDELSNPVLTLDSETPLVLKFDDLSGEVKDYSYTFIHCDADWNESIIMQNEYLDGFAENPLDDYEYSKNTTVSYINYYLSIPNEDVSFNYSGNYALVIFEDNDRGKRVLVKRFQVLEPLADIEANIKKATFDAFNGSNQELDFEVYMNQLVIHDANKEVKVVLTQNNRWDNAIRNLKPRYIKDHSLTYDYNKENVFPGGNEFRWFDIRSIKNKGENVESIKFFRPYYHASLVTDKLRSNERYSSYKEMNGNFAIESNDFQRENYDTECDYVLVHFTLPLPNQLVGGSVNVFGAFTNWNANKSNEMTWDKLYKRYELTMLLKQGYYNYEYVYVPAGLTVADAGNLEGDFYDTENDYQIYVYYRKMGDLYDRLVGFQELNSRD